tara:strand:+ start:1982 stop:5461 length:3480 start_codon:yes stop_codon:yes gene_type:complete
MASDFLNFLDQQPVREEDEQDTQPLVVPSVTEPVASEPAPSEGGFLDYLNSNPETNLPKTEPLPELEPEDEPPEQEDIGIDPELKNLVDQAYTRTVDYFGDLVDEQDTDEILKHIKEEKADKERIMQQMIDGGRFESREEALNYLRETNPESILLKSDGEALMGIIGNLDATPESQRDKMLSYLQSENAVTRRVAEATLRNMDESTLGAMNGTIFADEMLNPVTALADVPVFAKGAKTAFQEGRYLDAAGNVVGAAVSVLPAGVIAAKSAKGIKKLGKTPEEQLELARRYNYGGAELATLEAAEDARKRASAAAEANADVSEELIRAFEKKTNKTISTTTDDGRLVIDFDKAKDAGRETAFEAEGKLLDIATTSPDELITSPILNPDKFDGIVAAAAELKKANPKAFDNDKTIIENLLELTVSKDMIGGQELIDMLHKYGLTFEDYVLTVIGSGSDAGKVLNSLSQVRRLKPKNVKDADDVAKKAREDYSFLGLVDRKGVMRVENIRRGGLVSQIATAARNLTSGGIRAPLEGLGNVMDNALYEYAKPIRGGIRDAEGGFVGAGRVLFSGENWRGSFNHMKYMFSRPDVAKGYTDLILSQPQLAKQFDAMFNNINEIQKLTGRGSGTKMDKLLSALEDGVDVLNTPNRWQEYLIRRGQFFGELERLTKREYGIDLIDTLNQGKLKDLIADSSKVVPEGKDSFLSLVDRSVTKALDVTYAKQPDIEFFRSTSSFITRNGLTVIAPFPRFMFNSMELMGQYAGGSLIPLTRKVSSIVIKGQRGPLTEKDRQRISRNLLGVATVGAAYMYRSSEGVPAEYNQIPVGTEGQMDTTPTYPMAHFLYAGEATKRLKDGTFDNWFNAKEFAELFVGMNLRTGVGNSILEEMASIASGADLTSGEAAGRALGRTLGNYLGTWAVPFAQVIDAERAAGIRQTDFINVAQDPELNFWGTAGKEIKRSFQQRGMFLSPEAESELPRKEYPFYPDGKQRLYPEAKFLGATITNRPSDEGEYLQKLGYDYRNFGSKSKVPSIQAFEQKKINEYMTVLVDIAKNREMEELKEYYREDNAKLREEFTETEYLANMIRPLVKEKIDEFKAELADGKILQGDKYARALTKYRRIQPDFRKLATTDFTQRYNRSPDPLDPDDLNKLIVIAKAYKEGY